MGKPGEELPIFFFPWVTRLVSTWGWPRNSTAQSISPWATRGADMGGGDGDPLPLDLADDVAADAQLGHTHLPGGAGGCPCPL